MDETLSQQQCEKFLEVMACNHVQWRPVIGTADTFECRTPRPGKTGFICWECKQVVNEFKPMYVNGIAYSI